MAVLATTVVAVVVATTGVAARAILVKGLTGKTGRATGLLIAGTGAVLGLGLLVVGAGGVLVAAVVAVELGRGVVASGDGKGGKGGLDDVKGVEHACKGTQTEEATLVRGRGVLVVLTSLGAAGDDVLELVGADGVSPEDDNGDGHHLKAAQQRGDAVVEIGVGEGIGLVEDVGALKDPEDNLLEESKTNDKLNGNELGHGLQVGHVDLELDGDKEDGGNGHTRGQGGDDAEPELGVLGLALKLAVDTGDLGDDGGNGDTECGNGVLEDHEASLLENVSTTDSGWLASAHRGVAYREPLDTILDDTALGLLVLDFNLGEEAVTALVVGRDVLAKEHKVGGEA